MKAPKRKITTLKQICKLVPKRFKRTINAIQSYCNILFFGSFFREVIKDFTNMAMTTVQVARAGV